MAVEVKPGFTRCVNDKTGGEADLATAALPLWTERGWRPVDVPKPPIKKSRVTRSEA